MTEPENRPRSRRPHWVYDAGQEPEARDSLANERTFLAWLRTSLALVAGAVAVSSPALEFSVTARLLLSLGLVLVAAVALGVGCTAGPGPRSRCGRTRRSRASRGASWCWQPWDY